ncbi:MAG TPA: hypothetical protein VFX97_16485 [Pyrinomonadaceae bacterium]|nr:hypothetical protein [Pyrinomonadaceae bacterium]
MAQTGKLKLDLVDVFGKRLKENVDIFMSNLHLDHKPVFRSIDASKIINISKLHTGSQGIYQISIDPPSYHPVGRIVTVDTGGVTEMSFPFPVDISKIVSVKFPTFPNLVKELRTLLTNSPLVLGFENKTGDTLYSALDDIRRGGVMNIARKSLATRFSNNKSVLSLIKEIRELRGDRFFAFVDRELREEVINSINTGLFHKVDGRLHKLPPGFEGFEDVDSFKTDDHFGNLQVTFFRKGDEFVADIDIDDAGGLGHIFQVLRNHFTGNPTHPFNIHQILLRHQHLNPGYSFNLS